MTSRFSHLATLVLAGACGVLLLLVLLFQFGAGRGYRWWAADANDALAPKDQLDRSTFKLPAWSDFADVNLRPLFNEDRKPTPPAPPTPAGGEQKPVPKLNVQLSGVILSPTLHIAMIIENGKTTSSAVREGHSLPGELAAWTVTKVKPRGASFRSTAGEEVELELIAKGSGLKPPPPAAPAAPPVVPQAPPQAEGQPAQNMELQQRIEARRKQLQEQADRAKQQQGEGQQQPPQQPPGQTE